MDDVDGDLPAEPPPAHTAAHNGQMASPPSHGRYNEMAHVAAANTADGRPPGGTSRATGHKQPRRVQWAAGDAVTAERGEENVDERSPPASAHGLDLHARDPEAFEALTDALKRHRSASPPPFHSRRPTYFPYTASPEPFNSHAHRANGHGETSRTPLRRRPFLRIRVPRFFHHSTESVDRILPRAEEDLELGLRGRSSFEGNQDEESEIHPHSHRRQGMGVLSALLGLYPHTPRSGSGSGSGASTPRRRDSFNDNDDVSRGSSRAVSPAPSDHSSCSPSSPPSAPGPSSAPLHEIGSSASLSSSFANATRNLNFSLPSFPSIPSLSLAESSRPAQARNAGGVFGPLIASTANLTGPATPSASRVAPSVKRRGYALSRYEVREPPRRRAGGGEESVELEHHEHWQNSMEETQEQEQEQGKRKDDGTPSSTHASKKHWSLHLGELPTHSGFLLPPSGWSSIASTPGSGTTPLSEKDAQLNAEPKPHTHKRGSEGRKRRKKTQIYITRHVEEILTRQTFILALIRALIQFGAPSHRLQSQILSTARVLDIEMTCYYLPDAMLVSFEDGGTGTSSVKFVRQGSALDIEKLQEVYGVYWNVIHDETSVKLASSELTHLMHSKSMYNTYQLILAGCLCSASICSVSFYGSFVDCLAACALGGVLVAVQLRAARHELYSHIFELSIATLLSFVSAALASTGHFCYSAVASGSVVLILPGYIVLCGSLDITSRNIVSGAVRLCFALMYSLFLGFGLSIGAEVFLAIRHSSTLASRLDDYRCVQSHSGAGPWWQRTASIWWAFLTVPMYSTCLSLRFQASYKRKEFFLLVVISCIGWVVTHFASLKFVGRSDVTAAFGAFAVGLISNIYGRLFYGNAFVVMITGILFQVPSGLANGGGLLAFVSSQTENGASSQESYVSGFQTALQLVSVAIGLTVGLCTSLVVVHPVLTRRRAGGIFSL